MGYIMKCKLTKRQLNYDPKIPRRSSISSIEHVTTDASLQDGENPVMLVYFAVLQNKVVFDSPVSL